MKRLVVLVFITLAGRVIAAEEVEYRTGGASFSKAWHEFYVVADHEPDIDDSLIAAGAAMVPAVCEAIAHPDMARRRYAIGALGYIGDKHALSSLEAILRNREEIDYFRGDALRAIYQIDAALGAKYAKQFQEKNDYLKMVATAIERKESWLTEPSEE